jgi:hypothetical protein
VRIAVATRRTSFLAVPLDELAFMNIPASAMGYAMGKEVSFFRLNRRHPVSPA